MAAAIFVISALTIALTADAAVGTAVANAVTAVVTADADVDVDAEIIVVTNRMYHHSFILHRFGWVSGFAGPAFFSAPSMGVILGV